MVVQAAGQSVLSALGKDIGLPDNCAPNVNIMFPIIPSEDYPNFFRNLDEERLTEVKVNTSNAEKLWNLGKASEQNKVLVISHQSALSASAEDSGELGVSDKIETESDLSQLVNNRNKKNGFWCPITENIPGAPEAFCNKTGSTVIRSDLPNPEDCKMEITKLWLEYVQNNLKEPAFISIPCLVPGDGEGIPQAFPIAILNVDFDPRDRDFIYRGYHKEWLSVARDLAKDFIILAFHYYTLLRTLRPDKYDLDIKTNVGLWDDFPRRPY